MSDDNLLKVHRQTVSVCCVLHLRSHHLGQRWAWPYAGRMQGAAARAHALRAKSGRSAALALSPVAAAGAAGPLRERVSDLVLTRRRHQSPARSPQRRNSPGECPTVENWYKGEGEKVDETFVIRRIMSCRRSVASCRPIETFPISAAPIETVAILKRARATACDGTPGARPAFYGSSSSSRSRTHSVIKFFIARPPVRVSVRGVSRVWTPPSFPQVTQQQP